MLTKDSSLGYFGGALLAALIVSLLMAFLVFTFSSYSADVCQPVRGEGIEQWLLSMCEPTMLSFSVFVVCAFFGLLIFVWKFTDMRVAWIESNKRVPLVAVTPVQPELIPELDRDGKPMARRFEAPAVARLIERNKVQPPIPPTYPTGQIRFWCERMLYPDAEFPNLVITTWTGTGKPFGRPKYEKYLTYLEEWKLIERVGGNKNDTWQLTEAGIYWCKCVLTAYPTRLPVVRFERKPTRT